MFATAPTTSSLFQFEETVATVMVKSGKASTFTCLAQSRTGMLWFVEEKIWFLLGGGWHEVA